MVRFKILWRVFEYINRDQGGSPKYYADKMGISEKKMEKIIERLISNNLIYQPYPQIKSVLPIGCLYLSELDKKGDMKDIEIISPEEIKCIKCQTPLNRKSGEWFAKCTECGTKYNFVYDKFGKFKYMNEVKS